MNTWQVSGRTSALNPNAVASFFAPRSRNLMGSEAVRNSSVMKGLSFFERRKTGRAEAVPSGVPLDLPVLPMASKSPRCVSRRVPSCKTAQGIFTFPMVNVPVCSAIGRLMRLDSECSCKCPLKYGRIVAVVVAVAKLGDVLMEMAKSDAMVLADDAAFQQAPKSLNAVRVDFAICVAHLMIDDGVRHEGLNSEITAVLIRDEHGIVNINRLAHEFGEALVIQLGLIDGLRHDLAAAFDHADNGNFGSAASALVRACTLARFAADIALVHFHDAAHKFRLFKHGIADTHPHRPCRVLVDLKVSGKLTGRQPFLGIQNERDGEEPDLKIKVGMVEDRVDGSTKCRVAGVAVMPPLARHRCCAVGRAIRATRLRAPAHSFDVGYTIGFGRELLVDRADVHGYLLLRQQEYAPTRIICQEKSTTLN